MRKEDETMAEIQESASLPRNSQFATISADDSPGFPKYDFMTAGEVSTYLGIGLTQSYEICKKINAKLAEEGYLTFRGKVPRQALLAHLPPQDGTR